MPGLGRLAKLDDRDLRYPAARLLATTKETRRTSRYCLAVEVKQ